MFESALLNKDGTTPAFVLAAEYFQATKPIRSVLQTI